MCDISEDLGDGVASVLPDSEADVGLEVCLEARIEVRGVSFEVTESRAEAEEEAETLLPASSEDPRR